MIGRLRYLLRSHYDTIVQVMGIMDPHHHSHLYNSAAERVFGKCSQAYMGRLMCAEACFIVQYLMEREGLPTTVWRNNARLDAPDDHCFIVTPLPDASDLIFIDATFKQFLHDDRSPDMGCKYHTHVRNLEPFFVGSEADLRSMLSRTIECNQRTFGTTMSALDTRYWRLSANISAQFDLGRCMEDAQYLSHKPREYHRVAHLLRDQHL